MTLSLYHYASQEKFERFQKEKELKPTAPFNPRITDEEWSSYVKKFPFPIAKRYTCAFFEPEPSSWKEYGLFDLLMEEFAGGDYLLELLVEDDKEVPILVRDHAFHSPKAYGVSSEVWRQRAVRDSHPELREKWLASTICLRDYQENYVCPEVLIPSTILLERIAVVGQWRL